MRAGQIRDQVVKDLFAQVLKPRGFRRKARRLWRSSAPFHFVLDQEPDAWASHDEATLKLRLLMFYEPYHTFLTGRPFTGVDELAAAIYQRGLNGILAPRSVTQRISLATDAEAVCAEYRDALLSFVLPMFDGCSTEEGLLRELRRKPEDFVHNAQAIAGLLYLTGRPDEAVTTITRAREVADNLALRDVLGKLHSRMSNAA